MLLIIYVAIILFLLKKWSYFDKGLSFYFLLSLLLLKVLLGYFSFEYHNIYFGGGDSRIYLMGAHQLLNASSNTSSSCSRMHILGYNEAQREEVGGHFSHTSASFGLKQKKYIVGNVLKASPHARLRLRSAWT